MTCDSGFDGYVLLHGIMTVAEAREARQRTAMKQAMTVVVGMRVRLRKKHPCGGDEWTVTRTGADIGMVCDGCGRRVMLEREDFERRVRLVVTVPPAAETSAGEQ